MSVLELDERKQLADGVFASLADVPRETVSQFGWALILGGGDLSQFGQALVSYADGGDWLPRLQLASLLGGWALPAAGGAELLERLEDASGPPWEALKTAIETVRSTS